VIGEENVVADQEQVKKANLKHIFFPFSFYYKIWWVVTIIGAIATSFFLPYSIAFEEDYRSLKDAGAIVELILECIFSIDILVNFNLAVYIEGRLIFTRSEIVQHYFNDMFWVDLCSVFPFEYVMLWFSGSLGQSSNKVLIFGIFRLPRLLRLHRLKRFSDIMQYDGHVSFLWFTMLRNTAAVLVFVHWEACTMYFIARLNDFSEDTWLGPLVMTENQDRTTFDLYLTSLYYNIVTFCTVGYGDFSPVNSIEKLIGSFFMLSNIIVAAWIIGSITLLIVKGDEKTGQYRDSLDSLQHYGHMHQFDDQFMMMLKSQLKLGFQNQEISDEQVLKSFPSPIRRKILRKLYLEPLLQTQLMKGMRPQFVDAFLASCKVEIFAPREEIVERGSILSDLYLLVGGVAEVTNYESHTDLEHGFHEYADDDDSIKIRFEAGDCKYLYSFVKQVFILPCASNSSFIFSHSVIGEIGFFTESPQQESVTCLTVCKTLTISQSNYKMLENDHPGSIGKILKNLLAKVEEIPTELISPGLSSMVAHPIDGADSKIYSNYGGVSGNSPSYARDINTIQNETLDSVKECKFLYWLNHH
jgi:CRP-like cAMP-binding protein